ncbi:beta-1 adrenergic receptor-like [Babylonia areolata]|uniref:beta-1 adrenergic receptor-like n=1 Tax=Babylonia areolata TaxID=304850 RepID=UPI003FCFD345
MVDIIVVVVPVLGLAVMVLNSLAVITVVRTRSLWNPSHLYISSLALSDLLLGVFMVISGIRKVTELFNRPVCLTMWFFFVLCLWTSILLTAVISIDRFTCVAFPYLYERVVTNRRVILAVAGTWLLSIVLSVVMIVVGVVRGPDSCMAREIFEDTNLLSMVVFLLCFIISGVMYGLVSRLALRQLKIVACTRVLVQADILPLRETFRQKMRAVKLFAVVFVVFVSCWLPHNVVQFVERYTDVPASVSMALSVPGMLHSLCNFFIYLVISNDFRTAFKRMWKRN